MKRTRLIGFGLTILFLALILWRVDLSEFAVALSSANYLYVVPAAFCTLLGYLVRTARWAVLLRPSKDISFLRLFPVLMMGFMSNNVLPARVGEFVRAYMLGSREEISKSLSLATIVLERLFDGIVLVLFIAVLSLFFPLPGWGGELALIAAVIFAAASVGLLLMLSRRELAFRLLSVLVKPFPSRISGRTQGIAASFMVGLDVLRGSRSVLACFGLSVIVWCLEGLSYFLIIEGFEIALNGPQQFIAALFMLVVVNLGIMIPSAPGYIGTFQYFGILALGAFGVTNEVALGVATVSHAMQWLLVTGIGLICLWGQNLSFRQIVQEERAQ